MFTIDNHKVHAPGFTREGFLKAVERAKADGLWLGYVKKAGTVPVQNRSNGMTYLTTRSGCTCNAGQRGRPCKHRAIALYTFEVLGLDITKPGHPERTDEAWVARRDAA